MKNPRNNEIFSLLESYRADLYNKYGHAGIDLKTFKWKGDNFISGSVLLPSILNGLKSRLNNLKNDLRATIRLNIEISSLTSRVKKKAFTCPGIPR